MTPASRPTCGGSPGSLARPEGLSPPRIGGLSRFSGTLFLLLSAYGPACRLLRLCSPNSVKPSGRGTTVRGRRRRTSSGSGGSSGLRGSGIPGSSARWR